MIGTMRKARVVPRRIAFVMIDEEITIVIKALISRPFKLVLVFHVSFSIGRRMNFYIRDSK